MTSTCETQGPFERKITIEVPALEVENKVKAKLNEVGKKVKIAGFRPGKVPPKLLKDRYGSGVRHEVVEELINQYLFTEIEKQKLMPANRPHVHMEHNEEGQDLKFYAHFEVYPEIKLSDLKNISMDVEVANVAEDDVNQMITRIQKRHSDWKTHEGASHMGSRITIHFEGKLPEDEKPFTNEENFKVVLGDKQMIPGFEDELLGLKAGDKKEFDITFPESYAPQLAGKKAHFTIEVALVEEGTLPELTDEFCQATLAIEDGNVEKLKEKVRENLLREANEKLRRDLHKVVLEKLVAANPVEVPPSLVANELKVLLENIDDPRLPASVKESEEGAKEEAIKRVTYSLLLGQFIKEHNIQVDQKKVQQAVMNIARNSQDPEAMLRWFFEDKKRLSPVTSLVLEEQALDQLLQQINRNEIEVSYKEVMAKSED